MDVKAMLDRIEKKEESGQGRLFFKNPKLGVGDWAGSGVGDVTPSQALSLRQLNGTSID